MTIVDDVFLASVFRSILFQSDGITYTSCQRLCNFTKVLELVERRGEATVNDMADHLQVRSHNIWGWLQDDAFKKCLAKADKKRRRSDLYTITDIGKEWLKLISRCGCDSNAEFDRAFVQTCALAVDEMGCKVNGTVA